MKKLNKYNLVKKIGKNEVIKELTKDERRSIRSFRLESKINKQNKCDEKISLIYQKQVDEYCNRGTLWNQKIGQI